MNIARFSVNRPILVVMQISALVVLGAICLTRLPIDLLPSVSLPTVAISTQWPNVAPEEIEAQVTRPIEQAVSSVPGMYQVSSTTQEGTSTVRVQFRWGVDIGQAAVDVLQLVERAQRRFPNDPTLTKPTVFKFDPTQFPILVFGVSGEDDPVKLRTLLENQVTPILESAEGVASATVSGGTERAIIVDVDPQKLRAHNLSLNEVTRRLAQENLNLPAGIARQGDTEYTIRSLGWFTSPEEIARTPIGVFNGQPVALGQVADVRDAYPEQRIYTRLNGQPAVGVTITKQSGANTVATADAVFDRIENQIKQLYPQLEFRLAYDQSQFIAASVRDVRNNALLGGVLAVLVLLFFLRNFRSTLVVALSIPVSIVSTFALVYLCGFSLNTMSMGGLALATGLIVDDAVVVLENIFRHVERDRKPPMEAAVSGTQEILTAVVASTLTVIVVFLPLVLVKGQAGQMYMQFALVVMFSIAVSLLDAATIVPMLASRLIRGEAHAEELAGRAHGAVDRLFVRFGQWFNALDEAYRAGLRWTLRHRWGVIGGAAGISAASFLLVPHIGVELMPKTDSGDFNIQVKMPPGTALEKTDQVVRRVEAIVREHPDVNTCFAAAGSSLSLRGTGTSLMPYRGSVMVKLKKERTHTTPEVIRALRREFAQIPGATIMPDQFDIVSMLIGGSQNLEINIFGDDLTTLWNLSQDVMRRVRAVPGFENVDVNWQEAMPEIQWRVDREKAIQMGITFSDVANTLNTATNGTIATYYQEKGFQYPVIVRLPEEKRKTEAALLGLYVSPSLGGGLPRAVPLSDVAYPTYGIGPSQITRQDRQRYIQVTGRPTDRSPGEVQADIERELADMRFPPGYYWDWGTTQKRRAEEFAGMGVAVALAVVLIYMLLAAQFESLVHPLTILACVPLSAIGVILALFLTGRAFGLTAFIGLLMLVGIVVKNGILLVDYTNVLRGRGLPRDEAVLRAGPTRLRPILMTASAAILGMLPLAMGIGEGSETQAPMATSVVGGLFTSTLL
ncbi:MAG: efflux RND transporter permease subunit, partial [Armatimonadota bacterium]|nr:efflux RND transporter permease subunit [Armatimonadota bacterium]